MGKRKDWLPGGRPEILSMASDWIREMSAHQQEWDIPQAKITELTTAKNAALAAYNADMSSGRDEGTTQTCKSAFDTLTEVMREIKRRYVFVPPLSLTDIVNLGLKPRDTVKTDVKTPVDLAGVEVVRWAPHIIGLRTFMQTDMGGDKESNYRVRIYYAPVLPDGSGVLVAKRIGGIFFLTAPPLSAADLPNSFSSRRQHEDLILPPEASGLHCWLAARYENEKSDPGPLGSLIEVIVP